MFDIYEYDILVECYENAEGVVYKARHKNQDRNVLVKKLNGVPSSVKNAILKENKLYDKLSPEWFLPFTMLENETNPLFAIKEFPEGVSLKVLLAGGNLKPGQKGKISLGVLSALDNLHRQGLMCLDLQPDNIWVDENNYNTHFIDCSTTVEIKNSSLTKNKPSLISAFYSSPELTGRVATIPDERSDYYSFGVFLYELYCGKKPFTGDNAANIIYQQMTQLPVEPALINDTVGLGLSNIIVKLLNKNPEKRYATCLGLIKDLNTAFDLMKKGKYSIAFPLSKYDATERLILSTEVIGKDKPLLQLHEFLRMLQSNSKSLFVEIRAAKGAGKSMLINAFEKDLFANGILFVKGSFVNDNKVPYSGLREACLQLIKVLLSLPEDHLAAIKETLVKKGGVSLNILADFLPEFSDIIPIDQANKFTQASTTNESLVYSLAIFLGSIAIDQKQLILIWEDFQMANFVSLKLLQSLYDQDSFTSIMCIALMDEGTSHDNKDFQLLNGGRPEEEKFFSLSIPSLSPEQMETWLKKSNFSLDYLDELAQKLSDEANGIPSIIAKLLAEMDENNMLEKNDDGKWTIDRELIKQIELKKATDEERIKKTGHLLPIELDLFKLAVLLTQPFRQSFLLQLSQLEQEKFEVALSTLKKNKYVKQLPNLKVSDELWLECADEGLSQYVYRTISKNKVDDINFSIASLLNREGNKQNTHLYELLSFVIKLPIFKVLMFKDQLREGALLATKEVAFQTALTYWLTLIKCYSDEDWIKDDEAVFNLYYKTIETAIWALDDKTYDDLLEVLSKKTDTKYKIARLYYLKMQYATKHAKYDEVIKLGCEGISGYDISISKNPTLFKIITSLFRLNMKVGRKSFADFEKMHAASAPEDMLMLLMIENMVSAIFIGNPKMLPEVMSIQIRKALQVGLSDSIGIAFMSYAFILTSFTRNYKKAKSIVDISFFLHKKFNNPYPLVASNFIYGVFVQHWFYPIKESKKLLEDTYLTGRQVGNINIAFYGLVLSEIHNFFSGTSLNEVLERSVRFEVYATKQREKLSGVYFHLLISFCREMMLPAFNEKAYVGKQNEIEEIYTNQKNANDLSGSLLIQLFRNLIELLNNNYSGGEAYLKLLEEGIKTIGTSSYQLSFGYLLGGLKIARQEGVLNKEQNTLLKKSLRFLEKCFMQMPANHAAQYYTLYASYSRKTHKYNNALRYINQAIDIANENNLTVEAAIALEEKFIIQLEMGQSNAARDSLKNAYSLYEKWGAIAKLNKLKQEQSIILIDKNQQNLQDKGDFFKLPGNLDIDNLIKASNSIAGEIKMDQLLEKLFQILAETAGAQNIFLLVYDDAELKVYSHSHFSKSDHITLREVQEKDLPLSVINYVKRSSRVILINDISNDSIYKNDPYFKDKTRASILCLPLIKNQKLLGILYIENAVTIGAFTEDRLGLIKLLSTQIAISLENALLYESMETKVKFRTELLSIEKERTESLLLNILPRDVAEELKQKGTTTARLHSNVTVLFSDIVGFTRWSTLLDPQTLVSQIDFYFRGFDDIIGKYNLEKIKTVGDAYLAVGGLSETNPATPCDVAAAAMEMVAFVKRNCTEKNDKGTGGFQVRIGIHIGPVVAGVVGSKKFAFDIWGDTVNIAARLQENGEADKINISAALYDHIKSEYTCISRGKIQIKNHGELDMYFVTDRLKGSFK